LKLWSFETFGSIKAEIKRVRSELEHTRTRAEREGMTQEFRYLEKRPHEMFERDEIMYRQRSRHEWLKAGD